MVSKAALNSWREVPISTRTAGLLCITTNSRLVVQETNAVQQSEWIAVCKFAGRSKADTEDRDAH